MQSNFLIRSSSLSIFWILIDRADNRIIGQRIAFMFPPTMYLGTKRYLSSTPAIFKGSTMTSTINPICPARPPTQTVMTNKYLNRAGAWVFTPANLSLRTDLWHHVKPRGFSQPPHLLASPTDGQSMPRCPRH